MKGKTVSLINKSFSPYKGLKTPNTIRQDKLMDFFKYKNQGNIDKVISWMRDTSKSPKLVRD